MKINFDEKSNLVIAADIGGTNIRVALIDQLGEILKKSKVEYNPSLGIEKAGNLISNLSLNVSKGVKINGMGYSSAGPLNQITGEYINPPNLTGWHKKSLIPIIENFLGIKPKVGHDATLAALAETKFGEFSGAKDLIYLTVSTGVGAGMISNGNIIQGNDWFAGEVGHLIINPGGYGCSLGCLGCLEGNVSGTAIASIAKEKLSKGESSEILRKFSIDEINSKLIFEYAQKKDDFSINIINEVIENLGRGIGSLLATLNPQVIILGGSVAEAIYQSFWDELLKATSNYSIPFYRNNLPLKITTLGENASLLGASVIANN